MTIPTIPLPRGVSRVRAALALVAAVVISATCYSFLGQHARAATATGFGYSAVLQNAAGQSFTMRGIRAVAVQLDTAAVDKALDSDQLADATTALGGVAPTAGFKFTKTFDSADRSNFLVGLTGRVVHNADLLISFNGVGVDHMRAAPAYIAYVNQAAPPAGSSAAATDTIEVVAGAVKRVGAVASVPVTSFTPKVDAMDAYMVFGGKKHPLESVEGASVNTRSGDQFENDSRMKNIIVQAFTFGAGSKTTVGINVTKRWSKSDNTLWIGTRALKSQAAFSISYLKNNVQYLKYDMTNAILGSVVVTYPAPGATTWPTEHLRFISRLVDLKQTTS